MSWREALCITPGITAVIGSGGKSSLLRQLGAELAVEHTVVLCTTTKILPFSDLPNLTDGAEASVKRELQEKRLICVGTPLENGKLTTPALPLARLAELADYVVVEADGSARLPLKAHLAHEPVIPPEAAQTICVTGVSGFGLEIAKAAHRAEHFAQLAEASVEDPATPENTALVLRREHLADRYFFNQADTPERWEWALRAAWAIEGPAVIGSLRKGAYRIC